MNRIDMSGFPSRKERARFLADLKESEQLSAVYSQVRRAKKSDDEDIDWAGKRAKAFREQLEFDVGMAQFRGLM